MSPIPARRRWREDDVVQEAVDEAEAFRSVAGQNVEAHSERFTPDAAELIPRFWRQSIFSSKGMHSQARTVVERIFSVCQAQ